ncbi:MAG: sulfate transporter [Gammaproteobacteria bacterium]|jgi:SulP family sulfate permease|nr:sulfate transporter [Gammaproteobacteria bacterium]
MIAILEAYKAKLFTKANIYQNIIAGTIVAIVALPLSMAFAIASGASPQEGIYTAIVAALCISLFGGSRVQIGGPTGAFIVILAGITAEYGIAGLQMASLMAGFILILMGILRLGSVIKYIPESVIIGFTSGIAIIIWVGQWKYFFGMHVATAGLPFYQQIVELIKGFAHIDVHTTLLAAFSLTILIIWPKFSKKIPAPLVAMVAATAIQSYFKFDSVATLGSTFGVFPRSLPMPHWLPFSMHELTSLILPAFTIAMLGSIESLLSAVVSDGMAGTKHNSNQELIGQGIANILSPIFGGFAATGAIARTATNVRNGGNSPVAGITHSVVLILIILLLAPLASNIPLCCLAAILFIVAYNMSEYKRLIRMTKQAPYYDVLVLWVAFILTVFVNLVVGVNVGIILASLLFMVRMSKTFLIQKEMNATALDSPCSATNKNSITFTLNGPLFFGAVSHFEQVLENIHDQASEVIFNMRAVPFIDGTGLMALQDTIELMKKHHIKVKFIEMNQLVQRKLKKAHIIE